MTDHCLSYQGKNGDAIVVGYDGHQASDPAVRFAAREAALRQAPLVIVTAFNAPIDPDLDDIDLTDAELHQRTRRSTERALCRALNTTIAQLPPHRLITAAGSVAKVLLDHSENAALLVLAKHHRHLPQRLLHAYSTSSDIVHHTDVPVVIVATEHVRANAPASN